MAWIRLIQTGFEFRDINELDQFAGKGTTNGTITTTAGQFYTGSAALDIGGGVRPRGKAVSGTDKVCIRCGCFLRHNGTGSNDEAVIFVVSGSNEILVTYDPDESKVRIRVGGTEVASVSPAVIGINTQNIYYNFSLYVYRNSSTGVIDFYVGGNSVLSYSGNTGTYSNAVYVGGEESTAAWGGDTFVDDFYIDYSTSEETNLAPPSYRYTLLRPTSDGTPTEWICSTGSDNYANVDDTTPDSDSTYNYVTAIDQVDEFNITDFTALDGTTIRSLIPVAFAKKISSGSDPKIQMGLDQGGTEEYATAQSVTTTYAYYFDTFLLDPNDDSWTESLINSAKLQLKSAGTF